MKKFKVIAGPCVIESYEHSLKMAHLIKEILNKFSDQVEFYFKASFDKANRSSIDSYRGVSIESAKEVFKSVKSECDIPVITDIHTPEQAESLQDCVDALQIPAFLCRQTDLLLAAAKTGLPVNIKKGQFVAPKDMKYCIEKVYSVGNRNTWITERGTSFGYHNLVVDMRSFPMMREIPETTLIFDATHSAQLPGGGKETGGQRAFIPHLTRAASAVGIDGLFIEVHDNPDQALSDSTTQLSLKSFEQVITESLKIRACITQM